MHAIGPHREGPPVFVLQRTQHATTHSCDTKDGGTVEVLQVWDCEMRFGSRRRFSPQRRQRHPATLSVFANTLRRVWFHLRTSDPRVSFQLPVKRLQKRFSSTQSLEMTHLPCRAVNPSMPGIFRVKDGAMFHSLCLYLQRGCACNPNIPVIWARLFFFFCWLLVFPRSCPHPHWAASWADLSHAAVALLPGPPAAFGCLDSPAPHELPGSAPRDPGGGYESADWRWRRELLR